MSQLFAVPLLPLLERAREVVTTQSGYRDRRIGEVALNGGECSAILQQRCCSRRLERAVGEPFKVGEGVAFHILELCDGSWARPFGDNVVDQGVVESEPLVPGRRIEPQGPVEQHQRVVTDHAVVRRHGS